MKLSKDRIDAWYKAGRWTKKEVRDAVDKGVLTEDQYREITGEAL